MSCCRKLRFFIAFLCAFCMLSASAQERGVDNHFYVFVKENDGTRMDLPVNEHVESKITGVLSHKQRFILHGLESENKLTGKEDVFIEIIDTVQLKPEYFRLMRLKEKKGNREMVSWSNTMIVGPKDSSKDFIPTVMFPIDDRTYRIGIKNLKPGHYLIMYQIGFNVLIEFYDFDI